MKKLIRNLFIIIYATIAIGVTICLLSYNDYKVSEIGSYSLVIIDNDELAPDFVKGNLVIVNREDKPKVGDRAFFYNTYSKELTINCTTIINIEQVTENETTYTLEGDKLISSEYVIGSAETCKQYSNIGGILKIIESKWGFLLLIVLPSLIAFLYEIMAVIIELKNGGKTSKRDTGRTKRTIERDDDDDDDIERIRKRRNAR